MEEIGSLKARLDEPERKEIAHMATLRAEKRLELAAALREYQWASFHGHENVADISLKAITLMGQAGAPTEFQAAWSKFTSNCSNMRKAKEAGQPRPQQNVDNSFKIVSEMIKYLHGRITPEQLTLALNDCPEEPELPMDLPAAQPPDE